MTTHEAEAVTEWVAPSPRIVVGETEQPVSVTVWVVAPPEAVAFMG